MKKLILLITILAFSLNALSEKTVDYLQDRGGIRYEINAEKPFTGKLLKKYENGQKWSETNYKDGKKHGLQTYWHENGQKEFEGNYIDGKEHGLQTLWRENGQKEYRKNFKNGKRHGLDTEWYENGQKESETNYKDGKKHGLETEWYENGQKKIKTNFKDYKPHGLLTLWHENGQKKSEGNFKDGRRHGLATSWLENGQKELEICFKNDFMIALSKCAKNRGNKMKESLLNKTGIYIAYPTSAKLKSIYAGSEAKVNNKHTKVGIAKKSFKSRKKGYDKVFDDEVEFEPLVEIADLKELKEIEKEILINIKKEFSKVGQTQEWFETANRDRIKEIALDTLINTLNIKYKPKQKK